MLERKASRLKKEQCRAERRRREKGNWKDQLGTIYTNARALSMSGHDGARLAVGPGAPFNWFTIRPTVWLKCRCYK